MSAIEAGTLSIRGRLGRAVAAAARGGRGRLSLPKQALAQATALFLLFTVLFPILWVFALSLDPLNRSRPEGPSPIPPHAAPLAAADGRPRPHTHPSIS